MDTGRSDLQVRPRDDGGFTIVEALVAVTILAIAIVLSVQPVMTALRGVSDARVITASENLAQAEIEMIRSLDYEQVGLPGRTPSGGLTESRDITVEGRRYVLDVDVQYAGSVTGLDVIPQGGDGVEGTWDPGVDYKIATVTVTADGRESDPVVMETIVAPTQVGQHEGIANARVLLDAHEPFAVSGEALPELQVQDSPTAPIESGMSATEQIWPAIPPGEYTVTVHDANGWIIHPDDVVVGLDVLTVVAGATVETTLRVYRPATIEMEVFDIETSDPIPDASLTLTLLTDDSSTAFLPGEYTIGNIMPDTYDVKITAPGYEDWTLGSVNVPGAYPDPVHEITAYMTPFESSTTTTSSSSSSTSTTSGGSSTTTSSTTTTTTTTLGRVPVEFVVVDNTGMVLAGADVDVTHSSDGPFSGVTNAFGKIVFNLLDGEDYTAVGSTDWGHSPDTDPVSVGGWIDALELGRPGGYGYMRLEGGADAEFGYKAPGADWVLMPSNHEGKASFVSVEGWHRVGKRCLANGEVYGVKWVYVNANENRSTSVSGWCPPS